MVIVNKLSNEDESNKND